MRRSTSTAIRPLPNPCRHKEANARTLALMLVLFLAGVTVGALWVYRSAQKSVTPAEETGQDLTAATKEVLKNLNSTVQVQFYSLLSEGNPSGELARFVARVNALLASFKQEAKGKLRLTSQDVWTDANTKSASAAGVVPLTLGAESAYLGIVVSQDGRKETLSPLRPEWEAALEFDLARAIARVNRPPPTPVFAADIALAEKAAESIQRSIPNLASVSVEEGERILRKAALEEYMTAVAEMEREVKEAQQRVIKAEAAGSEADRQSALEQLRQVQKKHADNLGQITARAQAQIEALQRLKRQ